MNAREAGVGSVVPPASVARTLNVWAPIASWAMLLGDLQGANGLESILHAKLEPGFEDEKVKTGVGLLVGPEGPESILV